MEKYSFVVHINLQDLITEIKVQAVPYKRSEKSQLTMEFFVLFFTGVIIMSGRKLSNFHLP